MSKETFDITTNVITLLVKYVKQLTEETELKDITKGKYENDT